MSPSEEILPDPADAQYVFWSRYTATQARRSPYDHKAIDDRVEGYFRAVCSQIEPTLGLEIGAHEATFSSWLKSTFPAARSLAFEANPYVYEIHQERLTAAGVEYRHLAVSESTGRVELKIPKHVGNRKRRLTNRMASLNVHTRSKDEQVVSVDAVRLDDFVETGPAERIVAWIDVEGASGPVLEGSRQVLSRASAVYIEVENTTTWANQWLDTDVARFFSELGLVPVIRDIQRPHQYNVVFLEPRLATQRKLVQRTADVFARRRRPAKR